MTKEPRESMRPNRWVSTERFNDYRRAHAREHRLATETLKQAKAAVDHRLEAMNELRAQINSERGTFEQKDAAEAHRLRVDERLNSIESTIAGMKSSQITWLAALGIFFTVVQIVLRFLE